ncbi:MAG: hypothetical protein PUH11_06785 [Bacilli bacterium]|nr:hypothetical protein [Bacilli bacterium]MDY4052075.1 hypothetical protein [Bacilli bacterium]
MKKLFKKIKETKLALKKIDTNEIEKKAMTKASLFAALIVVVALIPFILVFLEFFKQYSIITPMFYVLIILVFILSMLIIPFFNIIYFDILKNYTEREEIQQLELRYVFLVELTNPLYAVFSFMLVLLIVFLVK